MENKFWDVVIVGAGPAGSTAAYYSAKGGAETLFLERAPSPGAWSSCGGGMAYFMKDLLGLPESLIQRELKKITLHRRGRTRIIHWPKPSFISLIRRDLDSFLAEKAVRAGAEIRTSFRVVSVDEKTGVVKGISHGEPEKIRGRLILFADGPFTKAKASCAIGFHRALPAFFAIAREIRVSGNAFDSLEFFLDENLLPLGYFWLFPRKETVNVGVGTVRNLIPTSLSRVLDGFIKDHPLLQGRPVGESSAGCAPLAQPKDFSTERALVAGDAAGMVNPITGGGLVHAVRGGEMAAREALRVLGGTSPNLLSYQRKWKKTKNCRWLKALSFPLLFSYKRGQKGKKTYYGSFFSFYFGIFSLLSRLSRIFSR